jgi:hypothetical protein
MAQFKPDDAKAPIGRVDEPIGAINGLSRMFIRLPS